MFSCDNDTIFGRQILPIELCLTETFSPLPQRKAPTVAELSNVKIADHIGRTSHTWPVSSIYSALHVSDNPLIIKLEQGARKQNDSPQSSYSPGPLIVRECSVSCEYVVV